MDMTDKFFPNSEWNEDAYEKHMVEEAMQLTEKKIAPWQTAMRGWLKDGGKYPTPMLRYDSRACALAFYCRGRVFEVSHGFSPCEFCPYGCGNLALFHDLSRALGEFRTV